MSRGLTEMMTGEPVYMALSSTRIGAPFPTESGAKTGTKLVSDESSSRREVFVSRETVNSRGA